jgi:hypothetical protein
MKKDVWLYAATLIVGAAAWLVVAKVTGKREAWDSDAYFSLAMPAVCLASFVCGVVEPLRSWRWGVSPLVGQFLTMLVTQGVGNLLPLGIIVFGVLSLPSILTARVGAFVRGKWFGPQSA